MGKLYDATVRWQDALKTFTHHRATVLDREAARSKVREAFNDMVEAVENDVEWDDRDRSAWLLLERLESSGLDLPP